MRLQSFTTPNGYNLLTTKVDSSNTSYQNNVRIFDFTSYNSTYDVYFIDMTWYNAAIPKVLIIYILNFMTLLTMIVI